MYIYIYIHTYIHTYTCMCVYIAISRLARLPPRLAVPGKGERRLGAGPYLLLIAIIINSYYY